MMRRRWGIAALALLTACTAPSSVPPEGSVIGTLTSTPSPTMSPAPTPTPRIPPSPAVSPTAPHSLRPTPAPGPRVGTWSEPPPRPLPRTVVNVEPPRRVPNAVRSFWVADSAIGRQRAIDARLRVQRASVAMWVELDAWHDIRQLEAAAEHFESEIYPRVRAAFGSEWTPGIDNDPRIHILHASGLGEDVLGYTSSLDEYPKEVHPLSNEAEMIVIDIDRVDVGSSTYNALLARQFQRLVQWNQDRNEDRWLKEGLAELAVALCGLDAAHTQGLYPVQPNTSLIHWDGDERHRKAVYSFAAYFHGRFGDKGTRVLTSEPANGIRGIDTTLEKLDADISFDDLFAEWPVTSYLDGASDVQSWHQGSTDRDQSALGTIHEAYPVERESSVKQYGVDYVVLRGDGDLRVQFAGQTQTPMLSASAYTGHWAWWSNRADESLTTLTRRVDLSRVEEATLTYRAWYDIEAHHDYATLSVRPLDGQEWHILHTQSGTGTNPYGNNPGWGYTGRSEGWVREEVDLSDYVGREIVLRFSYLTDAAITGEGFLVDDIAVSHIDPAGASEANLDHWEAEGFLPIAPFVPQRYLVLLIARGEETTVEKLTLGENQSAEWDVPLHGRGLREAVLVIAGTAPLTAEPAPYQLAISP